MNTLDFRDIQFKAGGGSWLEGSEGASFLDFFTDVGTASLGYDSANHRIVLERMLANHTPVHAPNLYRHTERDRAASRLCQQTAMDRVFFCNSGAESVEGAIKLARLHQYKACGNSRSQVIYSYPGGFHGRTFAALAAGDGPKYHTEGFGPLPDGFKLFKTFTEIQTNACAVILAPVFGNNDVRTYPDGWLAELQAYCQRHGILLIFDEVQSGSGRSGLEFTYAQRLGLAPDIVTLAKGLGMGAPVGAVLARGEVADAFTPGTHFSTFGGNPLCCAFINGMLDWATKEALEHVEVLGNYMRDALASLPFAKNVRGVGLLNAFDFEGDGLAFAHRCMANGLLIGAFRPGPGPVKITPQLEISFNDIHRGIEFMKRSYNEMEIG